MFPLLRKGDKGCSLISLVCGHLVPEQVGLGSLGLDNNNNNNNNNNKTKKTKKNRLDPGCQFVDDKWKLSMKFAFTRVERAYHLTSPVSLNVTNYSLVIKIRTVELWNFSKVHLELPCKLYFFSLVMYLSKHRILVTYYVRIPSLT